MNNNSIFYSYIYLNPLKFGDYDYGSFHFNYEPFYVGKGYGTRLFVHLVQALQKINIYTRSHKLNIIKQILKSGISKEEYKQKFIIKIQENLTEFCAFGLEQFLINLIGRKDINSGPLVNLTDGGEGPFGKISCFKDKTFEEIYGVEKAKEIKDKANETRLENQKGKISTRLGKSYEEQYGIEKATELKLRLSRTRKRKAEMGYKPPITGRHHTDESREKMSISHKGKPNGRKGKTFEEIFGIEEAKRLKGLNSKNKKGNKNISGRISVTNEIEHFYIKPELLDEYLNRGFRQGLPKSHYKNNTIWVNNSISEKRISNDDFLIYKNQGFFKGRIFKKKK